MVKGSPSRGRVQPFSLVSRCVINVQEKAAESPEAAKKFKEENMPSELKVLIFCIAHLSK